MELLVAQTNDDGMHIRGNIAEILQLLQRFVVAGRPHTIHEAVAAIVVRAISAKYFELVLEAFGVTIVALGVIACVEKCGFDVKVADHGLDLYRQVSP